jgi:hypothetical protein
MDGNSNSDVHTICSSAASSSPSPVDSNMPALGSSGGTETIGPQNPSSALPPKSKKSDHTSIVWEHFTKVEESDPDDPKAECNHCGKHFSCHPRRLGTSSMLNHIRSTCKRYPGRHGKLDKSQSKLSFDAKREGQGGEGSVGNLVIAKYNGQKIRTAIAKMIIVDELPFKFVDGEGFQDFMKTVEPRFSIPSRFTVMKDCYKLFLSEKEKLRAMFITTGARVCLTTDTWTSVQNLNYMVITCHFIDCDWNLHKRIISFSLIPDHKGETIGKKIETCMLEWGIDSIFTITVDNASSNGSAIDYLNRRKKDKVGTILDGKFMHVRCCAHILNLIVVEGLKEVDDSVKRVRSAVKYMKSSPSRFEKFKECVEREKVPFKGLLCLDVVTRWNSTFKMLDGAEKFQGAFQLVEEEDDHYGPTLFDEKNGQKGLGPPTFDDWDNVRVLTKFLKLFYDVTMRISGSLYVTSNMYVQEVGGIQSHLQAYCESDDYVLRTMAEKMKTKYDKYWGELDKVNLILYVAVILDPRTKLDSLDFWFKEVLNAEKSTNLIRTLKLYLHKLYDHYKHIDGGSSQVQHGSESSQASLATTDASQSANLSLHFMNRFHNYLTSKNDEVSKTEIERYLTEAVEKPNPDFDILNWWKVNSTKFPILALLARDVLAIPITTVASESAFSTGGRVLDPFRSSLAPKTVEALVCAQNWLRSKPISSGNGFDSEIVDDDESYRLESGMFSITHFLIYLAIY